MYCASCFEDDFLRDFVARKGVMRGTCPGCGAESPQVDATQLAPYLEPLADAYSIRAADGRPLADLWQEDWSIFSANLRDPIALVRDVLGVGPDVRFVPKQHAEGIRLEHWSELRREIKSVNRFFPVYSISDEAIRKVFDLLSIEVAAGDFFRARVVERGGAIPLAEMGAPPPALVSAGRANPVGIPYLYLASDADTAIAEVKPQTGAEVLVAGFRRATDARLIVVDLVKPRRRISPFKWGGAVSELRSTIPFIEELGVELSVPVQAGSAAIDYLASQYLCELAKKCGFSGVRYGSSVGAGVNYAFFDVGSYVAFEPSTRYRVARVDVQAELIAT